jgi:hypothetical protein
MNRMKTLFVVPFTILLVISALLVLNQFANFLDSGSVLSDVCWYSLIFAAVVLVVSNR